MWFQKLIEELDSYYSDELQNLGVTYDDEYVHGCADYLLLDLLRELGFRKVVNVFNSLPK